MSEVRVRRPDARANSHKPYSLLAAAKDEPLRGSVGSRFTWSLGLDGHLVAIVTPSHLAKTTVGPVLSIAPVVRDNVILSPAACWTDSLRTTIAFNGQLREVPGSNTYALVQQADGFHAHPLRSSN